MPDPAPQKLGYKLGPDLCSLDISLRPKVQNWASPQLFKPHLPPALHTRARPRLHTLYRRMLFSDPLHLPDAISSVLSQGTLKHPLVHLQSFQMSPQVTVMTWTQSWIFVIICQTQFNLPKPIFSSSVHTQAIQFYLHVPNLAP